MVESLTDDVTENAVPSFSNNELDDETQDGTSKKRKRDEAAPELEIDVSLPEPPSKKALRKAKKEKVSPVKRISESSSADANSDPLVSASLETSEQPKGSAKSTDYSIWIGNLPWAVNKAALRTFVAENSSITDDMITRVHMPAPQDSKASNYALKPQNKGFAYVDFATAEAFAAAIDMSETLFGGRRVLIKNAKSFEGRPVVETVSQEAGTSERKYGKRPSKRIFVGNLGFDVTQEVLTGHFQKCGDVENVHVATFEDTGKCKGFGWVTFSEVAAGEAAVRGWTYLPVEEENDEDENESSIPTEELKDKKVTTKKKKPKQRKWFVNQLYGRLLRCEFAEDPTVRYKKRFGKEVTVNTKSEKEGSRNKDITPDETGPAIHQENTGRQQRKPGQDIKPGEPTDDAKRRGRNSVKPRYGDKQTVYRTGAIAEPQGSKTVFD